MRLVTAEAMRKLDRATIESHAASGAALMERAGQGVVRAMERRYGPLLALRVLVLCGGGHNGGDGLVAARHLQSRGAVPRVALLAPRDRLGPDPRAQLEALEAAGVRVADVASDDALAARVAEFPAWDFALDALLGTGAHGAPEGLMLSGARALLALANAGTRVVAVDLPTGADADTGAVAPVTVRADLTVTFGAPKRAHLLYPARGLTGALETVDIGLVAPPAGDPDFAVELAGSTAMHALLPVRDPRAHKGRTGHVLVIGGSAGLTGAVTLAARGASRAGAGYVQVLVPAGLQSVLATQLVEQMALGAPETANGALSRLALPVALERARAADVVVLGSGLSREREALEMARALAFELPRPIVLDADALNAFEGTAGQLRQAEGPRVLTPHLGEMARLTGLTVDALEAGRIDHARTFAARWNAVVVLKGAPTVTAAPDGATTVNPTGNAGMATAGAGDVLSGVIAALIGQGLTPYDAARLGAYVHGLAGDLRAAAHGMLGMVAGDLAEALPLALQDLARRGPRRPGPHGAERRRLPR
ncbi:MAG TPA: NAD(P)H-hydrate dehydratase [Candidatus Saccharimonadaceae bacterium]|jgi:NAD(P)H-hydrate epimerase|nr:NAD(P)H-hydrate dehydratase [Candidatus Saccharimonadaceae bacterium]